MKNKYTINIDWLEISFLGKLPEEFRKTPESFEIAEMTFQYKKGGRTRHFNDMYEVFIDNSRIGHFLCNPHSEILNPELIKFKFDNNILYEASWFTYLELLIINTDWQLNNITRLDIACDFRTFANNIHPQDFIKGFLTGAIAKKGRECDVSTYGKMGRVDTIKFGAGASERSATLYNKSKELEKSGKLYIKRYHEENLLPASSELDKDVYRLEFRFSSKSLKTLFNTETTENFYDSLDSETGELKPTHIAKFLDQKFLSSIYRNELESFLNFEYSAENVPFKPCPKFFMFEWQDVEVLPLKRLTTKNPSRVYKIKLLIKTLLSEYNAQYVSPGQNVRHTDFYKAMQYMSMYELEDFVKKRAKHWFKDWVPTRINQNYDYKNPIDYIDQKKPKIEEIPTSELDLGRYMGNLRYTRAILAGKKNKGQFDYLKEKLKPCLWAQYFVPFSKISQRFTA